MTLIGYWPLNETDSSDSTAYDHSGRENHGTVNNGGDSTVIGASTGPTGTNAYQFDGNNDRISVGEVLDLSGTTNVSTSFWTRSPQNQKGLIFEIAADESNRISIVDDGSNQQFLIWMERNTEGDGSFPSFDANTWTHIATTFEQNTFSIYMDGVLIGTDSYSNDMASSTYPVNMGKNVNTGAADDYFEGSLSEVRIYDHALTAAEVQYLYTAGKQGRLTTHRKKS